MQARLKDGRLVYLRNGETLAGNNDRHTVVSHAIQAPVGTTAIRLLPTHWHRHISMRVALNTQTHECNAANLLANGSFEEHDDLNRRTWGTFASLPGWTVASGNPEIQRGNHSGIVATDGTDKLELDSTGNSTIYTDVPTVAGRLYRFTFDYTPRLARNNGTNNIDVLWNGAIVAQLGGNTVGLSLIHI